MAQAQPQREASLSQVTTNDVATLFDRREAELHKKVDATRDAYLGFIFPVNRADFGALISALDIAPDAGRALFSRGRAFSSFTFGPKGRHITNHIVGASLLALRGKSLDSGLGSVTDDSLPKLVREHADTVLEIAEARASWFGRIFFPAGAFVSAIEVFGGKVSADAVYKLAEQFGFAAMAGSRKTVRGDFGIAMWLTLLARA
jgi:hypothetical protein